MSDTKFVAGQTVRLFKALRAQVMDDGSWETFEASTKNGMATENIEEGTELVYVGRRSKANNKAVFLMGDGPDAVTVCCHDNHIDPTTAYNASRKGRTVTGTSAQDLVAAFRKA